VSGARDVEPELTSVQLQVADDRCALKRSSWASAWTTFESAATVATMGPTTVVVVARVGRREALR
jgi:hypothetical protein